MSKYRIRLESGRVIGPLEKEQIPEFVAKGHIVGSEDCQIFPTGDWKSIREFEEIADILNDSSKQDLAKDSTVIQKLKLAKNQVTGDAEDSEIDFPKKFEFEKKTPFSNRNIPSEEEVEAEDNPKEEIEEIEEKPTDKKAEDVEAKVEPDKTLVNVDTKKYLEELQRQKEIDAQKEKEELENHVEPEPEVDLNNDSTQFINLDLLKSDVKEELKKSEAELKKESREYKKEKIKKEKLEKKKLNQERSQEEEEDEEEPSKLKKYLVIIAIIAVVYVMLFPAEEKKVVKPVKIIAPNISFPIRFDVPSDEKATALYKQGILVDSENTYLAKNKAALLFKQSLENKFNDNPAAAKMIFLYSELLKDSNDITEDANTIFKLVQIFKTKAILDANYAAGIALFYLNMEKPSAAVKTVEKFNAVKKNNPTLDLFAVYLKSLMEVGNLVSAKAVVEKIATTDLKMRTLYVQLAMIDYYIFNSNYEEASKIVAESLKVFSKSIELKLIQAKLLIYGEDFKSLEVLLKKIREANVGGSKIYYSKYLEYLAMLEVSKGNVDKAIRHFKKALTLHESLELRSRLAGLSETTNDEANSIISESKALQLISSAKVQLKKNNFRFAFKDALEATRIAPNFIPAKIFLAKLQTRQSLFKEAIDILEKLYEQNPRNKEITFSLINAYIESYKFTDVKRILAIISATDFRNEPEFYSLTAKYYVYKNDFANAVAWLQRAINKNPLDDNNIFELAKMFIKYNKFDQGKLLLNKAMDLDPSKLSYRISFSKILYDIDGADAAIGYLYDILQDFPDNPKLLSQVGIFYYRSGQQKSFNNIKDKIQKLPNKDTTLYEFLIEAAELDGRPDDVVKYSKKLIELNPGDLKVRLNLGKTYMQMNKYKDALVEFKAIEDRLDTYPNLQLYMSKLYLLTDDFDKAEELAIKEVKANSTSEFGYILLGDIYSKKKEYLKAENEYKKAQKINGNNYDMLIGLAKINFKKSQYEIAMDLFLKARKVSPEQAEVHKLLGDAYRKMSQSALAVESYKLFLELSPTSKYKDEINTYIRMMQ